MSCEVFLLNANLKLLNICDEYLKRQHVKTINNYSYKESGIKEKHTQEHSLR